MAASYTKDETMAKMDALMKPYETPPESFTIGDIVKRYGITMNRAHKVVARLIAEGTLMRVSKNCYVTSPGRPVDGAAPESPSPRRVGRRRKGAR